MEVARTPRFAVYALPAAPVAPVAPVAPAAPVAPRDLDAERRLFDLLCCPHPTSATAFASLQERKLGGNALTQGMKSQVLTYGEVVDASLLHRVLDILIDEDMLEGARGRSFYDLGSGSGKMVIAAALTKVFPSCVGVEIMASLHQIALALQANYQQLVLEPAPSSPAVAFYHQDIFDLAAHDWTDAGVVYINSTCFDDDMMARLCTIVADRCTPGTVVITLSAAFPETCGFRLLREFRQDMSWGGADVFVQCKA